MSKHTLKFLLYVLGALLYAGAVLATEYSSTNYKILDPVIDEAGVISTSTSYRLVGTVGELSTGLSTGTIYTVNSGSVAYPQATAPTLTATAGAGQAVLSWTAAQGSLGWSISGYDVCTGTATNVYTCEDAGAVITFTDTGLTVGAQYFFRVRAKDAFGNVVARSNEATATPVASTGGGTTVIPPPSPPPLVVHDVVMSGFAYPNASISLLQDGSVSTTVIAGADGAFTGRISNVSTGIHTFGTVARDAQGRSSVLITDTINVSTILSTIQNIIVSPTVALSAESVAQGGALAVSGMSFPASAITVSDSASNNYNTTTRNTGEWSVNLNTAALATGQYTLRAKATVETGIGVRESIFSALQTFIIASVSPPLLPSPPEQPPPPAPACRGANVNLDTDGHVNLADVSVLLTFWNRTTFANRCADLNSDGAVNLRDFSILLFNWTG